MSGSTGSAASAKAAANAPLAERMRPRSLEEFVGQEKLVGEKGALRMIFEGGEIG
ncbi:MAG: replication-associated recombination protein A, partial [Planctomycetota bacterium]